MSAATPATMRLFRFCVCGELTTNTGSPSIGEPELDAPYDGVIELSKRLAKSRVVRSCLTDIWFTVALDRLTREQDGCAKQRILQALDQSNGSVPELLVALATSSALSHRRASSQ